MPKEISVYFHIGERNTGIGSNGRMQLFLYNGSHLLIIRDVWKLTAANSLAYERFKVMYVII